MVPRDTLFDLASLTKVIATTTVVMELVRTGRIALDEPIATAFDEWRGADRSALTELCERLGDTELVARVPRWAS